MQAEKPYKTTEHDAENSLKPGVENSLKKEWRKRMKDYQWMVKNLPFILFLAFLALIYIANGHYADKNMRQLNKTNRQLKELRWQYLQVKSRLMYRSKMSEVAKVVAPRGLKELMAPPEKIVVDSGKWRR